MFSVRRDDGHRCVPRRPTGPALGSHLVRLWAPGPASAERRPDPAIGDRQPRRHLVERRCPIPGGEAECCSRIAGRLSGGTLRGGRLNVVRASGSRRPGSRLLWSRTAGRPLCGKHLTGIHWSGCRSSESRLTWSRLTSSPLTSSPLTGSHWSGCRSSEARRGAAGRCLLLRSAVPHRGETLSGDHRHVRRRGQGKPAGPSRNLGVLNQKSGGLPPGLGCSWRSSRAAESPSGRSNDDQTSDCRQTAAGRLEMSLRRSDRQCARVHLVRPQEDRSDRLRGEPDGRSERTLSLLGSNDLERIRLLPNCSLPNHRVAKHPAPSLLERRLRPPSHLAPSRRFCAEPEWHSGLGARRLRPDPAA